MKTLPSYLASAAGLGLLAAVATAHPGHSHTPQSAPRVAAKQATKPTVKPAAKATPEKTVKRQAGAGTGGAAAVAISPEHQKMFDEVMARLIEAAPKVVPISDRIAWPPKVRIEPANTVNAYATFDGKNVDGKLQPICVIYNGALKTIVENVPDRLAFVAGHELAHVLHIHPTRNVKAERTLFMGASYTRDQEYQADTSGMGIALAAGYDLEKGLGAPKRFIATGSDYTSFEGVGVDHPSWPDRIARLDKANEGIWRSFSAFSNGVLFLQLEQYGTAADFFQQVTEAFPNAYDAWANLGYARLMAYCDALEAPDLRKFNVGHIVIGGFYKRPESFETRTGPEERKALWLDAVRALEESNVITERQKKGKQPLVLANLGVAHLVHPDGKDATKASAFFEEAIKAAEGKKFDVISYAAILTNSGVADLANGSPASLKAAQEQWDKSEASVKNLSGRKGFSEALSNALTYNRAMLLAKSDKPAERTQALQSWESYLSSANPSSPWWTLAYENYVGLTRAVGSTAKTATSFSQRSKTNYRLATSFDLGDGKSITLSESIESAIKKLGQPLSRTPASDGSNIERLSFNKGITLLADSEVIAIMISGPNARPLPMRGTGLGSKAVELKVGMTRDDIEAALGDDNYDYAQLIDPEVNYRFWRETGVAARVRNGVVEELIIAQVPEAKPLG